MVYKYVALSGLKPKKFRPILIGKCAACLGVITLIALLLGACGVTTIKQGDVETAAAAARYRIKDKDAVLLIGKGTDLYEKGQYEQALAAYSEAEGQTDLPGDKVRVADVLSQGGFDLLEMNLYRLALSYYERSLQINKAADDKSRLVNNYSYIGKVYTDIGKYQDGIRYFEEAVKLQRELNDKAGVARNLSNVANLYSFLGNYRETLTLLNQALKISEEIQSPTETANTLVGLGAVHYHLRNYRTSVGYLTRAAEIARKANEGRLEAYAFNVVGAVYRQQGDYEKALDGYLKALEINRRLGLKAETAFNLGVIGETYKETGRYEEALEYLRESLDVSEASGDKLITAANLYYMGEVKKGQENYEEALNFYNSSSGVFEEVGYKDGIARNLIGAGFVKGAMKDFDGSVESFDRAVAIYRGLGDREWIRVALFGRGVYSEEKGDLISAERNYKEAVDVFESIRQDVSGGAEAEQIFSDVNVKIYERLVSLLIRLGKTEEALEYIQRSRSKSLRDNLLKSGLSSFDDKTRGQLRRYDELSKREASINYELTRERARPSPNREKVNNLSKTLARTRGEFNQATSQIKKEYPRAYSALGISPLNLPGLMEREALDTNFSILQYFITEDETYIFTVSRSGLTVKSVSIKKEELNRMVSDLRRLIFESSSLGADKLRLSPDDVAANRQLLDELSTNLYGYLVEPVKGNIKDMKTVGIIPFGILNYLPFQALSERTADGRLEFFLEQKNLAYLTNVNQLDMALRNRKAKSFESAVAFGNPNLRDSQLALPYSKEEVQAIKDVFPNALVFLEDEATKENFKNSWGKHRIVHLSAHGVLDEDGQFILLAPSDTGRLSTTDITELPPAEMIDFVVLSACSTAIDPFQKNPSGTQLATLAFTFTWIQVPSVIATLWDISDQGTSILMRAFYQNLKDGKSLHTAFREAQVGMIKGGGRYSHPYYWASFVLFGDWR